MVKTLIDTKKWEVQIGLCHNFSVMGQVALPFSVSWLYCNDMHKNKSCTIDLHIFCFQIWIEIWKWAKGE